MSKININANALYDVSTRYLQTGKTNSKQSQTSNMGFMDSINATTATKDLSFATSKTKESDPLFAVLSFAGSSFSVYKADDYTEEKPTYLVVGKEKGKDFEAAINTNAVKPDQASMIEMAALQVHLKEKGIINNVELHPYRVDGNNYPVERSLFEKLNVISAYKEMYTHNLTNPRHDIFINLGKIMSALDSIG